MRGSHNNSTIKLECVNEKCSRKDKHTYRRFDSLKDFTCSLCGEELRKVNNKTYDRSLENAKRDYEKINLSCSSTIH